MSNLDYTVNVNVLTSAQGVARAGFDWILLLINPANAEFLGEVRPYLSASEVDSDADLSSGEKALAKTLFMQKNNPGKLLIGGANELGLGLSEFLAKDPRFYGVVANAEDFGDDNFGFFSWCEANDKLGFFSSDNAAIKAGTPGNDFLVAQAGNFSHGVCLWNNGGALGPALAWSAAKLHANPDRFSTVWSHTTLQGITADELTSAERDEILEANGNVYLPFKGIPVTFPGVVASGAWIDEVVVRDWMVARCGEAIAQLLVDVSSLQQKIPYTQEGLEQIASVVQAVLSRGEAIGHFVAGSSSVEVPPMEEIPQADKLERTANLKASVVLAGAISKQINFDVLVTS